MEHGVPLETEMNHLSTEANTAMIVASVIIFAIITIVHFVQHLNAGSPNSSIRETAQAFGEVTLKRKLRVGEVAVLQIIRQSGNIQRVEEHRSVESALASAQASFRRAKVDTVTFWNNGEERVTINRSWHNHRGRNEGKKFGGIDIQIIDTWTAEQRAEHEAGREARREADRAYRAELRARKQAAA